MKMISRPSTVLATSVSFAALVAAGGAAAQPARSNAEAPGAPVSTAASPAGGAVEVAQADIPPPPDSALGARLEGVVVTAERRSTSLQRTAVAISVVSSDSLDESVVNEISGLNAVVPSLEITKADGSENLVSIRGIGSETPENTFSTVPGISEFVDGVYIVNTVSLDETLFDIDHIEVLRGPQGDLYGESATGGAINLVTKQPALGKMEGSIDVSAGDYDLVRARGVINIPVGDTLAIRASVQKYAHNGFTKDVALSNYRLDDADDMSGKIAILWKPMANVSATLSGQWYHATQNGAAQKNLNEFTPAIEAAAPGIDNPREVYQDYPSRFELTTQLYHLNLQYDSPWFTVKSVTGFQYQGFIDHYSSSRTAYSLENFYDDVAAYNTKTRSITEEIDLLSLPGSPLEWDVGAFALNKEDHSLVAELEGYFSGAPTAAQLAVSPNIETTLPYPSNLYFGNADHVARQGYAAFGRATYHILPKLSLTVGARYNHDSYSFDGYNFSTFGAGRGPALGFIDNIPTWRAELEYQVTPTSMAYISNSRGYKPGGDNGKGGPYVVPETFKPEINTAFEIGSKNTFLSRTLTVNLAAYYYLYRDMQYIEYDPIPFESGISNIPSIHEYGFEGEMSYVSTDSRLHIDGDFALENGIAEGNYKTIDSTIATNIESTNATCIAQSAYSPACDAIVVAAAQGIAGKNPPDMPKFSGSISASYRVDTPFGPLTPRAQYVYRGSEWARIFNVPGLDRLDPYGVMNFNLTFVPNAMPRLRLSLAATNAFDVNGVNSRYTDPYGSDQTSQQYIPPRQIIGMVSYAF